MHAAAILIELAAFYDDDLIYAVTGISAQTPRRARSNGELRYVRKGRRILYQGQWLLDWLSADVGKQEAQHAD